MPLYFADLVRETSTASGTGALALAGALPGHRRFADAVPPGASFHYSISGVTRPAEWECGLGSIDAAGRLVRTPISSSAPGHALVDFSAGLKSVALTAGAAWFSAVEARAAPAIADVAGLQAALDGKQAAGSYAAASHSHSIANISGLQAALDARQPISTGHSAATAAAAGDTLVIRRGAGWLNLPLSAIVTRESNGNVGIGPMAAAPDVRLHIADTLSGNGSLRLGGTAPYHGLFLYDVSPGDIMVRVGDAAQKSWRFRYEGDFSPGADAAQNLGRADRRWGTIFAASGTISTSDAALKKHIGAVPDAWLDAWGDVRWVRYRFRRGKRWHIGLVAQAVAAAFAAHGLDAAALGLLCRDAVPDESAKAGVKTGAPAKGKAAASPASITRWGLRYDECLALEAAWQRRELARLAARIGALEAAAVAA